MVIFSRSLLQSTWHEMTREEWKEVCEYFQETHKMPALPGKLIGHHELKQWEDN